MARKRMGDAHDAEDICQDAFVTTLERIEDCDRPERFRGWLMTIVRNTALNAIDRRERRRTEPLREARNLPGARDPAAPDGAALRERLRDAIAALPEMQRKVLVMHDYEGWTHREIGRKLEIAAGTSRYHLHAARGGMRDFLRPYGYGEGGSDA